MIRVSLPPPHLQSLPYCNTIARPLRNILPATDPPVVWHTPYSIGDGNTVWRQKCSAQDLVYTGGGGSSMDVPPTWVIP